MFSKALLIALTASALAFAQAKPNDDDDDDAPAKAAPAAPKPDAAKPQAPAAPSDAKAAAAPAPSVIANPDAQRLVSGAPLFNPNVAVHIVEKKQFSDRGRAEVVLYPAVPQVNGKFTQHYGTAASFVYHLQENFAFQLTPQYNWYSSESDFNLELISKVQQQAEAATALLLVWGLQGGVEVTPLYGKFAFYEGFLAHFSVVLNAGAGIGGTRIQLKSANDAGPATFGDGGNKFLGSVGGGFRVLLGDRFALRIELRDLVYTARVDRVNGCNFDDMEKLVNWLSNPVHDISTVPVSSGCATSRFTGTGPKGYNYNTDIPFARNVLLSTTSDVLNNIGAYVGASFLF